MPDPKTPGRQSSYKPENAKQAGKLCELGATDAELADFFEVSVRQVHRWKIIYPEFAEALKVGKDIVDDKVERSLLELASGYRYTEVQAIKVRVAKDTDQIEMVEVERVCPPNVTAQIFWLKNRRPDQWRDVHKVEHGRAGEFDAMSDDKLNEHIAEQLASLKDSTGEGAGREGKAPSQKGMRGKSSGLH